MNRVLVPLALSPGTAPPGGAVRHLHGASMGTSWSVRLAGDGRIAIADIEALVRRELDAVIAQMSTWEPGSDISRFNAAPAGSWHALPAAFATVVDCALTVAAQSGGAFDPAVGPLVDLWGFGPHGRPGTIPPEAELQRLRAQAGWRRLEFDRAGRRLRQPGGVRLDLSGIAKGYAVDAVAAALARAGIGNCLVEVGGELRGSGVKPDGTPWWVELEQPSHGAGENGAPALPRTLLALHGLAVATSGDYRRFFDRAGRRYAHTIDPRTGCPVEHAPASVAVVHPECMAADALATALTVLGLDEGERWARRHGLAARFIARGEGGFTEILTPALAAMLE
ncbi:FAD:protein FMN transferase [Pigmentiphaga soli]|uniref:FAD:protein FMN transferase n=1 Tax=Pigmentiphaga soli TaxID=1007095 RepID=A0ABP8H6E5_9BURK